MGTTKISMSIITVLVISFGFLMSGCYTQLSRPDVDTDYYVDEDEEAYLSDDDADYDTVYTEDDNVVVDYRDVYFCPGPLVYFGPNVWAQWSPYYRYHHPRFIYYDPWWRPYDAGWVFYDPYWDPWYDDWYYYNYYYYHPSNYYWAYDDGHRSWDVTPRTKVRREYDRRDTPVARDQIRKQPRSRDDNNSEQPIKTKFRRDDDGLIVTPGSSSEGTTSVSKRKPGTNVDQPSKVSKTGSTYKPSERSRTKPSADDRKTIVKERPQRRPSEGQKSAPSKDSKPSEAKPSKENKPSQNSKSSTYKSPPQRNEPSGDRSSRSEPSRSSGKQDTKSSKDSDSSKSKSSDSKRTRK